jgi:hypothetical protein
VDGPDNPACALLAALPLVLHTMTTFGHKDFVVCAGLAFMWSLSWHPQCLPSLLGHQEVVREAVACARGLSLDRGIEMDLMARLGAPGAPAPSWTPRSPVMELESVEPEGGPE